MKTEVSLGVRMTAEEDGQPLEAAKSRTQVLLQALQKESCPADASAL